MSRRRRVTGASAALAAALALTSCSSTEPGPAILGLEAGVGIVNTDPDSHTTWVYGSWPACLDAAGQVTLNYVSLNTEGPIELVTAAASKRATTDGGLGSQPGPMPSTMSPLDGFLVSTTCTAGADELALEVRKTSPTSGAVITSFDLHYTSGGQQRVVNYPARIVLCSPQGAPAEDCSQTG